MLKRLFRSRPKISSISGFTLLEILASMIIASIIISTLFTVLFGILQSNRREDAKQKSQEELQAAANYIANDLQQAVYIYPSEALYNTTSQKYIRDLIPKSTSTYARAPILAFWKRYTLLDEELVRHANNPAKTTKVKCIESSDSSDESSCLRRDTFVYSLVVYYLEKGGGGGNVSKSVTISRFEARDGIPAPKCLSNTDPPPPATGFNCGITRTINPSDPNSKRYYSLPTTVEGASIPGQVAGGSVLNNFQPFSFQSGELVWKTTNGRSLGNEGVLRLIDYLDATPHNNPSFNVLGPDSNLSPYDPDGPGPLPQILVNDCEHPDKGGLGYVSESKRATRIPPDFGSLPPSLQTTSFYACVNSNQTVAKVFIRGNALIRLGVRDPLPTPGNRAFFPEVSVIGAGRGIVVAE
jgi:prepilin-type N-terminal cleavage/methylation domain-containing protein